MGILGNSATAGVFISREVAEEAWEALNDAGIPASVITDPGLLGKYSVSVEVERVDLDRAVAVLQAKRRPETEADGRGA